MAASKKISVKRITEDLPPATSMEEAGRRISGALQRAEKSLSALDLCEECNLDAKTTRTILVQLLHKGLVSESPGERFTLIPKDVDPPGSNGTGPKKTASAPPASMAGPPPPTEGRSVPFIVNLELVEGSPLNPRKDFPAEELKELAQSIRENGLIQPLVVRKATTKKHSGQVYEIIAGGRRLLACRLAGLKEAPAILREGLTDTQVLQLMIVENLQRSNISPMEQANSFKSLLDSGMTQEKIAESVGVGQSLISKYVGLLKLPDTVRDKIGGSSGLSPTHGANLQQLAAFPKACTAVADDCLKDNLASKEIEGTRLMDHFGWTLSQKGLAVQLNKYNALFEFEVICRECPHHACRADSNGVLWCLKPSHYEELQQKAAAERHAALKEQLAEAGDGTMLKIADLSWQAYTGIDTGPRRPAGCVGQGVCACWAQAIDHNGAVVEICTDRQRYYQLSNDEFRAKEKAIKLTGSNVLQAVGEQLLNVQLGKLFGAIASGLLDRISDGNLARAFIDSGLEPLKPRGKKDPYRNRLADAQAISEMCSGPTFLSPALGAVALALLREEIERGFANGSRSSIPLTEWLMGWAKGKLPPELVVEPVVAPTPPAPDIPEAGPEAEPPRPDLGFPAGVCQSCNAEVPEDRTLCADCDPDWPECRQCGDPVEWEDGDYLDFCTNCRLEISESLELSESLDGEVAA